MKTSEIIWLVSVVAVGIAVWVTASQALAIVWGVLILVAALTVTGVLPSLYNKLFGSKPVVVEVDKPVLDPTTEVKNG